MREIAIASAKRVSRPLVRFTCKPHHRRVFALYPACLETPAEHGFALIWHFVLFALRRSWHPGLGARLPTIAQLIDEIASKRRQKAFCAHSASTPTVDFRFAQLHQGLPADFKLRKLRNLILPLQECTLKRQRENKQPLVLFQEYTYSREG